MASAGFLKASLFVWIAFFCTLEVQSTPFQYCHDYLGHQVLDGTQYIPSADDLCHTCTCDGGYAVACASVFCSPPQCQLYEVVEDECCTFNCLELPGGPNDYSSFNETGQPILPDEGFGTLNSANLPLRLVASTVTSFLILALLLFMIHRLRQRRTLIMLRRLNAERQEDDTVAYLPQMDNIDIGIEYPPYEDPPPPYTPPKPPYIPEGEAPPPYDDSVPDTTTNENTTTGSYWVDGETRQSSHQVIGNGSTPSSNGITNNGMLRSNDSVGLERTIELRESGSIGNSPGNACVQSSNTEQEQLGCSLIEPQITNDSIQGASSRDAFSYGLSVSVTALSSSNDSSPSSIVLRFHTQSPSSQSTSSEGTDDRVISKTKIPSGVSNFIKRSNSIEIRHGSNSPRNSFYLSSMETSMSSVGSYSEQLRGRGNPDSNSKSPGGKASAATNDTCLDVLGKEISINTGASDMNYPLGWDPSVHSPTTDGSSIDSNSMLSTETIPRPLVSSSDSNKGANRKNFPPKSLELSLQNSYSSQCEGYDLRSTKRLPRADSSENTLPRPNVIRPRPSYQTARASPNSPHSERVIQGASGHSNQAASSALTEMCSTDYSATGIPRRVQSPASPMAHPFNRSGSVTSQVSVFSVCSETGEKKRPGFSLPPEILGNDVQYPSSSLYSGPTPQLDTLEVNNTLSCDQSHVSSCGTHDHNEILNPNQVLPPHDLQCDTEHIVHDKAENLTEECSRTEEVTQNLGENRTNHEIMPRTRPKIMYRDPEEMTSTSTCVVSTSPENNTRYPHFDKTQPKNEATVKSTFRPENDAVAFHKSKCKSKRPISTPVVPMDNHVRPGNDDGPDRENRSNNEHRNPRGAEGGTPQFKQYGFIDDPKVLMACKDKTVYPEAGDKVLNMALFEKLCNRSLSRDRRDASNCHRDSSGYSSKSMGEKSGDSSGERSRSQSRSRSRERVLRRRREDALNIDSRRWSEPPNANYVNQCNMNRVVNPEHNSHNPRRRKKRKSHLNQSDSVTTSNSHPIVNGSEDPEPRNSHYLNNNVIPDKVEVDESQPSTSKSASPNCVPQFDNDPSHRNGSEKLEDDVDDLDR